MFDYVLIGSSPGMLLEAIILARAHKKVLVIDQGNSVGGAWVKESVFGHETECAPHFFQSQPSFGFLEKEFPDILLRVPPSTWRVKVKGISFLTSEKNARIFSVLLALLIRLKRKITFWKKTEDTFIEKKLDWFNELVFYLTRYKEANVYLKNGSIGFIDQLHSKAIVSGVQFLFNTKLQNVNRSEKLELVTGNGEKIFSEKILYTARSVFGVNNEDSSDQLIKITRTQIFLKIKSFKSLNFYLRRSIGAEYFAVTNLSYLGPTGFLKDEYLIVATLSNMSSNSHVCDDVAKTFYKSLIQEGLITDDSKLIDYSIRFRSDDRMSEKAMSRVALYLENKGELVGDIDFSIWLKSIKNKWRES